MNTLYVPMGLQVKVGVDKDNNNVSLIETAILTLSSCVSGGSVKVDASGVMINADIVNVENIKMQNQAGTGINPATEDGNLAAILAAINLANGAALTPTVKAVSQGAAGVIDLGAVALKSQYLHGLDGTLTAAAATLEFGYSDDGSATTGGASNYICIWGPNTSAQYGGIVRDWGKIAAWCPTVPAGKHLVLKTTVGGFGGSITFSHPT